MTSVRSKSGINKTDGRHEGTRKSGSPMRCSEFLPTMVASYLEFRGWIRHDPRCNGTSVTFELSQSLALGNGFVEAMRRQD